MKTTCIDCIYYTCNAGISVCEYSGAVLTGNLKPCASFEPSDADAEVGSYGARRTQKCY